MTKEELNQLIDSRVENKINEILNPVVEIVSTHNPIPEIASECSVGYDIKADLHNIQEKFLKDAQLSNSIQEYFDNLEFAIKDSACPEYVDGALKTLENYFYHKEPTDVEYIRVKPGGKCLVPTGIYTAFSGRYGVELRSRSGNAVKFEVIVLNEPGTIEGDYKNEWGVIIKNLGTEDFIIKQGDKICQAVFHLVVRPVFLPKNSPEELSGSDRGGGFGHSGK